ERRSGSCGDFLPGAQGGVRSPLVRGEFCGERRAEVPAVMGCGREEVASVSGIEPCQGLWSWRVEPEGAARPQQVLRRGEGALALAGQEHLRDVRRPGPVDKPAAVRPARPGGG